MDDLWRQWAEQERYEATCTKYVDWHLSYDYIMDMPTTVKCYRCEDGKELCK